MLGLMSSVLPMIFGGLFLLLGVALLVVAGRNERKAAESRTWPTAQGRIVESRMIESTSTDSDGMTSTSYKPSIRYTYKVGGKEHEGDRLNRGMNLAYDLGTARRIIGRYPQEATVDVFYNPSAPAESALETKAQGGTIMRTIGVVMAGIGVLCLGSGLVLPLIVRSLPGLMGF